jgi:hypothetical protein
MKTSRWPLALATALAIAGCSASPPVAPSPPASIASQAPAASAARSTAATSTPAPSSPSPTPCVDVLAVETHLAGPCDHVSTEFFPTVRFRATAPWAAMLDIRDQLALGYGEMSDGLGMSLIDLENVFVRPCDAKTAKSASPVYSTKPWSPKAGVGPQELVDWLKATKLVPVSATKPVTIGGSRGLEFTVHAPTGSLERCGGYLMIADTRSPGGALVVPEKAAIRIDALDLRGLTVIVWTFAADPADLSKFAATTDTLLATLTFP